MVEIGDMGEFVPVEQYFKDVVNDSGDATDAILREYLSDKTYERYQRRLRGLPLGGDN